MDSKERYLDGNIARLIRAGLPHEARLDPAAKEHLRRQLVDRLRARHAAAPFPDLAMVLLTVTLTLAAVWLAARLLTAGVAPVLDASLAIAAALLALNLVSVAVAAVVIVKGRRHVA